MKQVYQFSGRLILLAFFISNLFSLSYANSKESNSTVLDIFSIEKLDEYLQKSAESDVFSGAVLVAQNDKIIFEKAYGIADRSRNIPNTNKTRFNLGSINKMFTAVAIAQLAEKGKISFNDPLIKYLPDYPNKSIAEKVTIHQLLTHTSGLGTYFNDKFRAGKANVKSVKDFFQFFVNDPLAFEPGTNWQYSNVGFILLGAVVEKVSGQDYYDYVKEHIYKPAGMNNTGFYGTDKDSQVSIGYIKEESKDGSTTSAFKSNVDLRESKGGPAGGGYSTIEDMFNFGQALHKHKLLNAQYTDLVMTGKVNSPIGKYGYGFGNENFLGRTIIGHNGGGPGIGAQFDMFPDSGYTIVVFSNYDYPRVVPVIRNIRKITLGESLSEQKKETNSQINPSIDVHRIKVEAELKKNPAGKTVLDFIDSVNSGNVEMMRRFHREHGGNEKNAEMDMQFYRQNGVIRLDSVVSNAENKISILVQTKTGDWMKMEFHLGAEPPYPMKGLQLVPVDVPTQEVKPQPNPSKDERRIKA